MANNEDAKGKRVAPRPHLVDPLPARFIEPGDS